LRGVIGNEGERDGNNNFGGLGCSRKKGGRGVKGLDMGEVREKELSSFAKRSSHLP